MRAASELAGEFGFGSQSKDCGGQRESCMATAASYERTWIEVSTAETSYMGLQLFCKISRQIPPSA